MFYKICTMTCLIGIAREVCEFVSKVRTLLSLQFAQTDTNAFLTYSEMKEFASRVLLISFVKTKSTSESSCLLTLFESSFSAITAFLLREDLKLSANFMRSGVSNFIAVFVKISL
jgi:hypothetical protein